MSYVPVLHTAISAPRIDFIPVRTRCIYICFDRPKRSDCNWYDSKVAQLVFPVDTVQQFDIPLHILKSITNFKESITKLRALRMFV